MDDGQTSPPTADPGAAALAFLLQLLGLPAAGDRSAAYRIVASAHANVWAAARL